MMPDLAGSDLIQLSHMAEAQQFHPRMMESWQPLYNV